MTDGMKDDTKERYIFTQIKQQYICTRITQTFNFSALSNIKYSHHI